MVNAVPIPFIQQGDKRMLLLNMLSDTGNLRAAYISKPRQVQDFDKHHCSEVNAQGSIRWLPKKWIICPESFS